MAGSLNHIIGRKGKFSMDHIENMGDAYEALEECFHLIHAMTGGKKEEVNEYCRDLNYPEIDKDMKVDS